MLDALAFLIGVAPTLLALGLLWWERRQRARMEIEHRLAVLRISKRFRRTESQFRILDSQDRTANLMMLIAVCGLLAEDSKVNSKIVPMLAESIGEESKVLEKLIGAEKDSVGS